MLITFLTQNSGEIVTGLFGVLVWYLGTKWGSRGKTSELAGAELERTHLVSEISFREEVLSFPLEPWQWAKLDEALDKLFENTNITRFYLLKAFNGRNDPTHATGIMLKIDKKYKRFDYKYYRLGSWYKQTLYRIRQGNDVLVDVAEMPDEEPLKNDYQVEGIKFSFWTHFMEETLSDMQTVSISYASFSSHTGPISAETVAQCNNIGSMVREWCQPIKPKES